MHKQQAANAFVLMACEYYEPDVPGTETDTL